MPEIEVQLQAAALELRNILIEDNILKSAQREQSQSIAALDREAMLRNGQASLVRMLEAVPGVTSINTGMGVSKPVIRGLGFNRVVVAENGIKQEGQQWGGDHGLEIDQFAVERVEVMKGPASLLYGSDGIGGVVNIRPALAPERNTLQAGALLTARSVNDFIGSSWNVALNKNDRYIQVRFSTQDYADYRIPADSFTYNTYRLPLVNRRLKNTAGRERNAQVMLGTSQKWGYSNLTFSYFDQTAGLFSGAHGIPRSYQLTNDGNVRNIDLPRQHVQHSKVLWNTSVLMGKRWLEVDLGWQYNQRREYSNPHAHGVGPTPSGILELEFLLQTLSANLRYHFEGKHHSQWVAGISGNTQQNRIGGFSFLIPLFNQQSAGAFLFRKQELNARFIWNMGLRYDYGHLSTEKYMRAVWLDSVTVKEYVQASPQLNRQFGNVSGAVGFSWFVGEHWNVKCNLGSGYRIPTAPELTANGVHHGSFRHEMGDSTLRSERGFQSDLALHFEGKRWDLNLTPFFNYFDGFIFLDPQPYFSPLPDAGLIYRFNQANAIHYGAELQSDVHLTQHLHLGLSAQIVNGWNLETKYSLPFMPPAHFRLDLGHEWSREKRRFHDVYAGLQAQGVFDQNQVARNEPSTLGFLLLHAQAGFTWRLGKKQDLRWIFNVQNIFNTRYFAHLNRYRQLNLPEAGRNVMLTLMVPFKTTIRSHEAP
jgi:iron complex outermembrane receptor protein